MANRPLGVLVADDEEGVRVLVSLALTCEGMWPCLAADGLEAVELFRAHLDAIAVSLLDVRMPKLSGPATLARLRALAPALPCVFMSGAADDELRALGCRVVYKPFRVRDVVAALRAAAAVGDA